MNIHKLKKHQDEIPYFMLSREVVQSLKNPLALAIWVYLQSKSDDWKVVEGDIQKQFSVGRTSYLKAMKCLRDAQLYAVQRLKNDANQFVGSIFHIYEVPTSTDFHTDGEPHLRDATRMETHTDIKEEEIPTEEEISKEDKTWLENIRWQTFYDLYPKKVDKMEAEKVFKKLSYENQCSAIFDMERKRYAQRAKKYIPSPAKYLRRELWNDEEDEVEITSHHQISSMVNQQAEVKQLSQEEIRRLANAH
jgi:hypothetical protein